MSSYSVTTQWDRLRLHGGHWYGSFARLDATGKVIKETPSLVTLMAEEADPSTPSAPVPPMRQTVAFGEGEGNWQPANAMTYRSLSRGILFLANGAYSQGSLQSSPIAEFGAEFGFVMGDRRLRAVVQYAPSENQNALTQLTLIREHRDSPAPDAHPPLTVEQLAGTWHGRSTSIYPDWYEPAAMETRLAVEVMGDRLHQTLMFPGFEHQSTAAIENQCLIFPSPAATNQPPIQVLLLPNGASITAPQVLPKGHPFFLEVGWLVSPTERQRLIRHYDAQGAWSHLTLVIERKA